MTAHRSCNMLCTAWRLGRPQRRWTCSGCTTSCAASQPDGQLARLQTCDHDGCVSHGRRNSAPDGLQNLAQAVCKGDQTRSACASTAAGMAGRRFWRGRVYCRQLTSPPTTVGPPPRSARRAASHGTLGSRHLASVLHRKVWRPPKGLPRPDDSQLHCSPTPIQTPGLGIDRASGLAPGYAPLHLPLIEAAQQLPRTSCRQLQE